MEKNNGIQILSVITVFIFLIIGLNLLPSVAESVDNTQEATDTIGSEAITMTTQAGQTAQTLNVVATSFGNTTHGWAIGTDLNVTTLGVVSGAANVTDGSYLITYTYQPAEYIENGPARAIINIVLLFFVLGILAIGVMSIKDLIAGKIF